MSFLRIPRSIYDSLRLHGEQTYPHECCGVLIGEPIAGGWRVRDAVRARNTSLDSTHTRYSIDPGELVRIHHDAFRRGLDVAGFYHSHPDHRAEWSATDFAEAHWIGCVYVITEVAQAKSMATNAFLLAGKTEEDKRFETQRIMVEREC